MTGALAVLIAAHALVGQWEASIGVDATTRAGVTPLAAGVDPVSQVRLEAEPSLGLVYRRDSDFLALTYRPRIVQRFILGSVLDPRGMSRTASVTGPLVMNQFDLGGHLQATRRLRFDTGVGVGVGSVAYNDAVLFGAVDAGSPGASTDATVLEAIARATMSYVTDSDRDTLAIGATGSISRVLDDQVTVGVIDRTRITGFSTYTFNPTRVDAVELAANVELALYPTGATVNATESSAIGLTGGWIRQFSRRVRCGMRAGAVALIGGVDPIVLPSGGGDCSVDTYRSAGLRIIGNFAAALIGSTSAVTAAAEPRIVSSLDFRFFFPPDKGLRLIASFSGPIRVDGATAPPPNVSDAALQITAPFSWQIDPGLDVIVGAGFGVRGRLDGAFDQIDAQGFVSLAWSYETTGNSRYQRP